MKKMPIFITLLIAKSSYYALKLLGKNSGVFSGSLALKIDKDILGKLSLPKTVIMVTGTNGKTSTSNLIDDTLRAAGYSVIDNHLGSNILNGVASAFINACDLKGVCKQDFACIELDERSSRLVFPYIKPDYLVVTNLQRDTLLRTPHPSYVFSIINECLPKNTKLILNADDLISSRLGADNEKVFYRVDKIKGEIFTDNIVKDISVCPKCHSPLEWKFKRYNSIGQGYCPNCDFKSYKAKYIAKGVDSKHIHTNVGDFPAFGSQRIIDLYNETAVIALLKEMGFTDELIYKSLDGRKPIASRYKKETIKNVNITSMLAKTGPVALSNTFYNVSRINEEKSIIIILDDPHEAAKSSEINPWLYDTDFEFLNNDNIKQIVIGGIRSYDVKLRMLMAGVAENKIVTTLTDYEAGELIDLDSKNIYVLYDTYNAVPYRKIMETLKRRIA